MQLVLFVAAIKHRQEVKVYVNHVQQDAVHVQSTLLHVLLVIKDMDSIALQAHVLFVREIKLQ